MEFNLRLNLSDYFKEALSIFHKKPPSYDDGLNGTFNEKIRRFNNAAAPLEKSVLALERCHINNYPIIFCCRDTDNPIDRLYRELIRNIYMELVIYQEKIINIVCNFYFIKYENSIKESLSKIKERSKYFAELEKFYDECCILSKDEYYQNVRAIRNDEVHNMSRLDSFTYDIKSENGKSYIVNLGYKLKALELYMGYIVVLNQMQKLRNIVQKMMDEVNFWKVYRTLEKNQQEIYNYPENGDR